MQNRELTSKGEAKHGNAKQRQSIDEKCIENKSNVSKGRAGLSNGTSEQIRVWR